MTLPRVLLVLLAAAFALLAATRRDFDAMNDRVLAAMPNLHAEPLTAIMKLLSDAGDTPAAAAISTAAVLLLAAFGRRRDGLRLAVIMILGSGLNFTLKQVFADPRPDVFAHLHPAGGHSFPSGHAQAAVALYGTLALTLRRRAVMLACIALAAAICFGRVYLGVHRPTEVLAGMLVGTFAIAAGYAAWPKNRAGLTTQ